MRNWCRGPAVAQWLRRASCDPADDRSVPRLCAAVSLDRSRSARLDRAFARIRSAGSIRCRGACCGPRVSDRRAARQAFRRRWRERIEGDPSRSSVYKDIGTGIASAGIEYYLPLFFDQTATLFDYLPPTSVLALHGPIEAAMARFWNETSERYRFLSRDATRPILPPADLFLNAEGFFSRAKDYARISLGEGTHEGFDALPLLAVERRAEDPISRVRLFIDAFGSDTAAEPTRGRVLIVADSAGRRETISQMLTEYRLPLRTRGPFMRSCG